MQAQGHATSKDAGVSELGHKWEGGNAGKEGGREEGEGREEGNLERKGEKKRD